MNDNNGVGTMLLKDLFIEVQVLRESILRSNRFSLYYVGHAASNAKGITQYALSLAEFCLEESLIEVKDVETFKKNIEQLQITITSLVEAINIETTMLRTIRTDTRSLFLFILSFFSAAALFMRETIEKMIVNIRHHHGDQSIIAKSIAKIFAKDINILLLAILIFMLYYAVVLSHQQYMVYRTRGKMEELHFAMVRNMTKLIQYTNPPVAATICFTLSLIIFLITIWALYRIIMI